MALKDSSGQRVIDPDGIRQLALDYYRALYIATTPTAPTLDAEAALLHLLPPSFTDHFPTDLLTHLGRLPDLQEVKAALFAMAPGKRLISDGVLTEFYRFF
ncbi:hypothetical protein M758_UG258400 [Ceratodon purpureus]|nr:hypothetical protein M758_UG258400 [Ceratodon purpureus]